MAASQYGAFIFSKVLQKFQGLISGPHLSWLPWPQEPASPVHPRTLQSSYPGTRITTPACWRAAYQSEFVLTVCPALCQHSRYPTFIGFEGNRAGSYPKVKFVLREETFVRVPCSQHLCTLL